MTNRILPKPLPKISIAFMIINKKISTGVIASFVLFIVGIVQAIRLR